MLLKKSLFRLMIPALLLAPIFIWGGMNATGFCWAERRWLSDEEIINIAIKNIIDADTIPVQITLQPGKIDLQHYTQIKYQSANDFKSNNPDCCKVERSKGWYYTYITGILKYSDGKGNIRSYHIVGDGDTYGKWNNCGQSYYR